MAIRPVDVRRKEFKIGFRGYDANQVDDFLDEVADEYERTFAESRRLSEEVTNLQRRMEQFEELESAIREALVQAQQAAQDVRQNANKEAELIVREAKEQSQRILADSSMRVERVQESYEVLRKAKQDFASDFRRLLKSYYDVMDNVDVASAKDIEASLRERLDLERVAVHEDFETQRIERAEPSEEQPAFAPESTHRARNDEAETGDLADDTATGPARGATEDAASDTTQQRTGPLAMPATGSTFGDGSASQERGPAPEAEEPEEDPSSVRDPRTQEDAARDAAAAPDQTGGITEEIDREEPMPVEENRVADEFFDEDRTEDRTRAESPAEERGAEPPAEERTEERKLFRASRFLRRRE